MFLFVWFPSRSVHPYANPEVLSFPVEDGSLAYMKWMDEAIPDDWCIIKMKANLCMDCSRTRKLSHAHRLLSEAFGSKGSESSLLNEKFNTWHFNYYVALTFFTVNSALYCGDLISILLEKICTAVTENTSFRLTGRCQFALASSTTPTNIDPVDGSVYVMQYILKNTI